MDITKNVPKAPDFLLTKVIISGNTKINEKKLRKFTNKLEGKKVGIQDLKKACDDITNYYVSKGYLTTRAVLKAQKVENGVVEITVDEGKYGNIDINGNKWAKETYLNNILAINGVKEDAVLNVNNLQNAIEEINNQKYIRGNVIVNKGKRDDLNEIKLEVEDRLPVNLGVDWNNYGTELTGNQRAFMKLSYDNITGYGDSIYGGLIFGNNNLGSVAGYSLPVGKKGTKLNLGFSSYNVNYGGIYRDLGLYGNWKNYSIGLTHPVYRGNQWTIDSMLNFDICNVNQGLNAIGDLSSQKLRVLRTGLYAKRTDSKGFWSSGLLISTGLPIMGATDGDGRAGGTFVKGNLGINRLQILPKRSMLLMSLNGQYTPNELLSPEKLALGGINSRGYETASALGDTGIFGTLELRTPVPGLKKILPERFKGYEEKVKMGYFYDFGIISDVNGYGSLISNKATNILQSVGVGLHFPVGDMFMVNLDLGVPIGDRAFTNQDVRLTFSLSSSLQNMWNWKKVEKQSL